jgi:hypothetical protein
MTIHQNEDENIMEGELLFTSDAKQFHTLEKIMYTMPRIPMTKERPARYRTSSVTIMKP